MCRNSMCSRSNKDKCAFFKSQETANPIIVKSYDLFGCAPRRTGHFCITLSQPYFSHSLTSYPLKKTRNLYICCSSCLLVFRTFETRCWTGVPTPPGFCPRSLHQNFPSICYPQLLVCDHSLLPASPISHNPRRVRHNFAKQWQASFTAYSLPFNGHTDHFRKCFCIAL